MSMKMIVAVVCVCVFLTAESFAGQNPMQPCSEIESIKNREGLRHVTIDQIMGVAINTHPQVEKSQIAIENAFDDITAIRAARFPQISANFDLTRTHDPTTAPFRGDVQSTNYGLTANLLLFDFGAVRHQVEAAKARYERSQYALVSQEYAIALAAADSYLDVLQQRLALDYALFAYQDLRKIKQDLMDSKVAKEADINKVWQTKEAVCLSTRTFLNEHQKATNFFVSVVDLVPEDLYLLQPGDLNVNRDVEYSIASALENHPVFAMADAQIADSSEQVIAAQRERYPKLNLIGTTHNFDQFSEQLGDRSCEGGVIGLRLTVPLFTGGRLTANIDKAQGNRKNSELDRVLALRAARRQISDLSDSLKISKAKVESQQSVVDISKKLFEEHKRQLYANLANHTVDSQNVINLVDERVKLYKAEVDLNTLLYAYIMDEFYLLAQQGLLMEHVEL